jgi:hypothetical protein
VQKLLEVPLVDSVRVRDGERLLLVVCLDKVFGNGTRLPDGQVVLVAINNGRETAIGVDLEEGRVLWVGNINLSWASVLVKSSLNHIAHQSLAGKPHTRL